MELIITTKEKLESLIDSSVSKAVKNVYTQKEKEKEKKKYYTIKEASNELRVSILTIRNYIDKGYLNSKKLGKRVLISSESIDNALQEVKSLKYKR
jgi:excisionase family DNA binding protein